jgi:tetratricopeptide (TPR) repeat protein
LDADIAKTEKAHQAKPADAAATKALADAYFARADALTEARQYRSALGDYRKGLKLDPTNQSARTMHDQIIDIFNQMGREVPAEGTEPPAMRK